MTLATPESETTDAPDEWFQWALSQAAVSRWVNVDGNRLHYLAWNEADISLPPLLFVHGFRAHARWWEFIAPFFMQTHRVYALDLSGMGDSGHRASYSAQILSNDINGFLAAVAPEPAIVVAHSYGGLCAMRAAAEQPERFRHLVAIDSYVLFENEVLPSGPARISGARIYPDLESARNRYRLLPPQPVPFGFLVDHVALHSLRKTDHGYCWKFDSALQEAGTHEHDGSVLLSRMTARFDYLYGERSALIDDGHAWRIVRSAQNASEPIVIPDAHHHLLLDQPIALISTLRALFAPRKHE